MKNRGCARLSLAGLAIFSVLFLSPHPARANALTLSDISLTGRDAKAKTIQVKFNIRWEDAWRNSTHYDAAWVFIKYSTDAGATWKHATLAPRGHTTTPGVEIVVPTEPVSGYKGAFIQYAAATSSPTLDAKGTTLVWDYGGDGVTDPEIIDSTNTRIRVFGIEMVYVPQGSFFAGDFSSPNTFRQGSSDPDPWVIASENAITTDDGISDGYHYPGDAFGDAAGSIFTIPGPFPKGYAPFYLMKYEISHGQYVDFLNTLTRVQQGTRVASNVSGTSVMNTYVMSNTSNIADRNTIQCPASGNGTSPDRMVFSTGSKDSRAANHLSWPDVLAYADWAALRPITELEFEKAARGPLTPVPGEYAWGTTDITQCVAISGAENGTETCATPGANCNFNHPNFSGGDGGGGPLRIGIFERSGAATREETGAGYYGNLDLSGNLFERVVTVGNAEGRAFPGTHGDGALSENGFANVDHWPGNNGVNGAGGEVVAGITGAGFRGGGWNDPSGVAHISSRGSSAGGYNVRKDCYGGRVGRTP